jgi:hypothetical protein
MQFPDMDISDRARWCRRGRAHCAQAEYASCVVYAEALRFRAGNEAYPFSLWEKVERSAG